MRFSEFILTKDSLIMLVFAVVMLAAAVSMIRKSSQKHASDQSSEKPLNLTVIAIEGLVVGAVTGFVGAGGGFLIIPALVLLAGLPIKLAIGTSLFIIAIKSLLGFGGDIAAAAQLDWTLLAQVTGVAIGGLFVGTYLSKFVPSAKLKPAFGWFVLLMGHYILLKQIM